jgi:hypothetical protein
MGRCGKVLWRSDEKTWGRACLVMKIGLHDSVKRLAFVFGCLSFVVGNCFIWVGWLFCLVGIFVKMKEKERSGE